MSCCEGGPEKLSCKLCQRSPSYYRKASIPQSDGVESGLAARDEAMARVDTAAPERFKAAAERVLWNVARRQKELSSDDIWAELTSEEIAGVEPRALGPVLHAAGRRGWIVNTRRQRLTSRAVAHARPVTIWESRIMVTNT